MKDRSLGTGLALVALGVLLAWWCHGELAFYGEVGGKLARSFNRNEARRERRLEGGRIVGILAAIGGGAVVARSLVRKG